LRQAKITDVPLIEKARRYAQTLFEENPELQASELQPLISAMERFWGGGRGDIS
jgi:hypothetical protein